MIPRQTLSTLLNDVDLFAVENVAAGRGGPFGASLHVYDQQNDNMILVGDFAANAVLQTGLSSAHAEDQAMQPGQIARLKKILKKLDKNHTTVILSSSGESCPACHTKAEILARSLISEKLINSGHFLLTYGATYKDTLEVAGFNDEPYHHDMQKSPDQRMIKIISQNTPEAIMGIFEKARAPVAIVAHNENIFIGRQDRKADLMRTAEIDAIRKACLKQKESGSEQPWNLEGATLYMSTSTSGVGPLTYAECQWANITRLVVVEHERSKQFSTKEAPCVSNAELFGIIAQRPYNGTGSSITIIHVPDDFKNKAQFAWKEKLERDGSSILYNGAKVEMN